jgi:hypothetical protein
MATNKPQSVQPAAAAQQPFAGAPLPQGSFIEQPLGDAASHSSATLPQPRKSFFRGVAVGIAIMIPIWAWLILRLVH